MFKVCRSMGSLNANQILNQFETYFEGHFDRVIESKMAFEEWARGNPSTIYRCREAHRNGSLDYPSKVTRAVHVVYPCLGRSPHEAAYNLMETLETVRKDAFAEGGCGERVLLWRRHPGLEQHGDVWEASCRLSIIVEGE